MRVLNIFLPSSGTCNVRMKKTLLTVSGNNGCLTPRGSMLNPVKIRLLYGCAIKGPVNTKLSVEASSPLDPFPRTVRTVHTLTQILLLPQRGLNSRQELVGCLIGEILVCPRGLLFSRCRGKDGTVISSLLISDINNSFLKWPQSSDPWDPWRQVLILGHRLSPSRSRPASCTWVWIATFFF